MDFMTAAKNIVTALNQLGQTYMASIGTQTSVSLTNTAGTLISTGQGRLISVSVTATSGAVRGTIYDSSSAARLVNPIASINHTLGVQIFDSPYNNGLVIVLPVGITGVVVY